MSRSIVLSFSLLSREREVLQPSDHLSGPPLDPPQQFPVLLVLGAGDLVLQMGPDDGSTERENHLHVPAGHPSSAAALLGRCEVLFLFSFLTQGMC